MKDITYFQLRAALYNREEQNKVAIKLQELEDIWFCTKKNVKRKLRKFEEEGKLLYTPGQGRGNASFITFKQPFQEEVEETVLEYADQDQLDELIQLLQLPIPRSWIVNVSDKVKTLFGLHSTNDSKDVLRTIVGRNFSTMEPLFTSFAFESYLLQQLGDTLVNYDKDEDAIKPHLAHHWFTNEDYTEWTFYLRKGIQFHHQRMLTSEDVKYTFERFMNVSSPFHWLVKDIIQINCLSDFKIQFVLANPNPFFLRYVTSDNLVILPNDIPFDEYKWFGTGPFRMKERTKNKLVLEAFDYYFLDRPLLDEIEFWCVPMEAKEIVAYKVDGEDHKKKASVHKQNVEIGFRFISYNFRKDSIIQNPFFREALYHLFDPQKLHKDLNRGVCVEASSYFPWKSKPRLRNRSLVDNLLKKSGYKGETINFYLLDTLKSHEDGEWFKAEAASVGINLELFFFDLDELYTPQIDSGPDIIAMGEIATIDTQLSFLGAFYNEALSFRRLLSPEHLRIIDGWLEEFKGEPTRDEREKWIDKIEQYLRENHLILYRHHPIKNQTFDPMIKDIHFTSFGHVDFRKLWIQK